MLGNYWNMLSQESDTYHRLSSRVSRQNGAIIQARVKSDGGHHGSTARNCSKILEVSYSDQYVSGVMTMRKR